TRAPANGSSRDRREGRGVRGRARGPEVRIGSTWHSSCRSAGHGSRPALQRRRLLLDRLGLARLRAAVLPVAPVLPVLAVAAVLAAAAVGSAASVALGRVRLAAAGDERRAREDSGDGRAEDQ